MDKIFSDCEVFEPEAQKNEQYGEKWLKDSVSNVLIQIQKESILMGTRLALNFNKLSEYN